VEWEDSGMNRESGAAEACDFVRYVDFDPSDVAFDDAMQKEKDVEDGGPKKRTEYV
jgi:hypothetical protein